LYRSNEWRQKISNGEKPIILFVSRLVWEKDLRILAQTYRELRSKRSDFEMVIVGDGHARQELEAMMPGAHFLGYQSGKTLTESFASADIFVFPSTTETFGLVTLEAMASGLAPVAAKVGGAVEIIQEGSSGLFAEPLDSPDLTKKVEWLLDNPNHRKVIADHALARAQEYRWGRILDQLFESYKEVIEEFRLRRFPRAA
jgi:glycosyltransferase involved in cell wall biosynthesis